MSGQEKIYKMVTEQIISKLEEGTVPWQKPWKGTSFGIPYNLKSKKPYRGINILLLGMSGYSSKYWVSYKQAQEMGGQVKKGEKGHLCVFWKILKTTEKDRNREEKEKNVPLLRYYKVFNLDQIDGIEEPGEEENYVAEHSPIESAQNIIDNMDNKPKIIHNEQRAYYNPREDFINLPKFNTFKTAEDYYSVAFHELIHSTGHESRLNRPEIKKSHFGSGNYSFEELVAEMGAAFLATETGIENNIDNSAAYIQSWLEVLNNNPKWVVQAAGKAQKAADFINNRI